MGRERLREYQFNNFFLNESIPFHYLLLPTGHMFLFLLLFLIIIFFFLKDQEKTNLYSK